LAHEEARLFTGEPAPLQIAFLERAMSRDDQQPRRRVEPPRVDAWSLVFEREATDGPRPVAGFAERVMERVVADAAAAEEMNRA
jgi:hypothetical protein